MRLLGWLLACSLAACAQADGQPGPPRGPASTSPAAATGASPGATTIASGKAVATAIASADRRAAAPRIAFVGDIALSMGVRLLLEKLTAGKPVPERIAPDFPFTHVADILRAPHWTIGNLECVLSRLGAVATDHNPFRCPLDSAKRLLDAGVDLVSVANNHALDFGQVAFRDMMRRLDQGGLPHFGKESLLGREQAPAIKVVGGVRVGILAYYWPPKKPFLDLQRARSQVDVLVVFPHWGLEDQPEPLLLQRRLARDFIDAGADLVVGTHAHVPQPNEWYRGKLAAYGLGNFVFAGMTHTELHRTGMVLEVELDPAAKRIARHTLRLVRIDKDGAPHPNGGPWTVDPEPEVPIRKTLAPSGWRPAPKRGD